MSEARLVDYLPPDIYQPLERLFQYPDNLCNDSDRTRQFGSLVHNGMLWNVTYYWYDTCVKDEQGYPTAETVRNLAMFIFRDKPHVLKSGEQLKLPPRYYIFIKGNDRICKPTASRGTVPLKKFLEEATYDPEERLASENRLLKEFQQAKIGSDKQLAKDLGRDSETPQDDRTKTETSQMSSTERSREEYEEGDQAGEKVNEELAKVSGRAFETSKVDETEISQTSSREWLDFWSDPNMVYGLGLLCFCMAYIVCRFAVGMLGLG